MSGGGPGTVLFDGICMKVGCILCGPTIFGGILGLMLGGILGGMLGCIFPMSGLIFCCMCGMLGCMFGGMCCILGGTLCGMLCCMLGGILGPSAVRLGGGRPIGGGMLPDAAIFCIRFMPNIAACINRGLGCGRFG
jgi:hypothetical protein